MQPNRLAQTLCDHAIQHSRRLRLGVHDILGARVLDFGVEAGHGGIEAGLFLARICLSDLATVSVEPSASELFELTENSIRVVTDHPLISCLGSQYAGWPVQISDFFAMASGPMRMARGREAMLEQFGLVQRSDEGVVGVLECDKLPNAEVIRYLASECHVEPTSITLCVAPVTSIAGAIQVVARSVETALHKMHAIGLDPMAVQSATGIAPLPPLAIETVKGIGRTNDAILYGGRVTFWIDADQAQIDELGPLVPSGSSKDAGKPFAEIFKSYNYDFYKVDPQLFSPAKVTFINSKSGQATSFGRVSPDVLAMSFGARTANGAN